MRGLAGFAAFVLAATACRHPEHAVTLDLIEAFPATDSAGPTTQIRAGDRRAADNFLEGWSPPERGEDGQFIAWSNAPRASISFDAGPRPLETTVVLDCVVGEPSHVPAVFARLNGRPVGRFRLSPGAEQIRVALRAEQQVAGRNVLDLFVPGGHVSAERGEIPRHFGVRSLRFESEAARSPAAHVEGDRLVLTPGTTVTYFLRLPPDARLAFESGERTADRLRVAVQADERPERLAGTTRREPGHLTADLGPEAGAVARLALSTDGTELALVRPRIEGRSVRPAAAAPRPTARASNVVLYVADTLRADRLGCFGYGRPTSPRLDAFARESIVFETAMAQASWTRPSTASILTGRYPAEHGARSLMSALRADLPTMATILAEAGYDTAAFVTNLNVAPRFGFDRGFAEYHYLEERDDRETVYVSAAELNAAAFPWLDARSDRPFFLYLHATDTHAPYRPPPGYAERFLPPDIHPTIGPRTPVLTLLERPTLATADNIALLGALYDGEVALLDEAFGALLDRLRAHGLDRSTLVVFVADHGEEFHDHGGFDHGRTLYQELVRVPLLMRLPGGAGARRVRALARQIDVLPTILAVLGLEPPKDLPGSTLLEAAVPAADETMMETQLGHPALVGVVAGRWKAVWGEARPGAERVELYDLVADPAERWNLASDRPVVVGYARQTAARLRRTRAPQEAAPDTTVIDPETERRLRALGYVDADAR